MALQEVFFAGSGGYLPSAYFSTNLNNGTTTITLPDDFAEFFNLDDYEIICYGMGQSAIDVSGMGMWITTGAYSSITTSYNADTKQLTINMTAIVTRSGSTGQSCSASCAIVPKSTVEGGAFLLG